jgi:hypothetical protein
MGPWNVCYLNGQQFFHHDLLGDFSVTFTQAGGINSDEDGFVLIMPFCLYSHHDYNLIY